MNENSYTALTKLIQNAVNALFFESIVLNAL